MRSVWRQSFNGLYVSVAYPRYLSLAGANRLAIELDGASPAGADAASELCSLHIENVSEHPQEGHIRGHIYCLRLPVDFKCVGHNINLLEKDSTAGPIV